MLMYGIVCSQDQSDSFRLFINYYDDYFLMGVLRVSCIYTNILTNLHRYIFIYYMKKDYCSEKIKYIEIKFVENNNIGLYDYHHSLLCNEFYK